MTSRAAMLLLALALVLALARPTHAAETPRLRVVLVLDASGSMVANDPAKLVRVAAKILSDLADERDHITVMSFGSEVKTLAKSRGSEHDALRNAIDTLGRNESCTDYAMALEAAVGQLQGKPPKGERRVVMFLTDGRFEPVGERGACGRFETAAEPDRRAIITRVEGAAQRLKAADARLFTIALGAAPASAQHSAALLRSVASMANGRFVHAKAPRDVPHIFASIFGGLVGSPVMQMSLDQGGLDFEVPRGADRVHLLVVPEVAADLDTVALAKGNKAMPFEPKHVEVGTQSGYRLARVLEEPHGKYRLTAEGKGRLEVLMVPDVGLELRIEGVTAMLPEGDTLAGSVALRTRAGDTVRLAPEFLEHVTFTVALDNDKLFDQRPDASAVARFASAGPMRRGAYTLRASAGHALGFLDVAPVEMKFRVEPRFALTLTAAPIAFDTMAEEGALPLRAPATIEVTGPAELPIDIDVELRVPEGRIARDVHIEPTHITFGPNRPRKVELTLRWQNPRALRGESFHYQGEIALVAQTEHARMLTGKTSWVMPVDGKLRAWDWRRYFREYKWQILGGLAALLLIGYLIGRALAQKFPPKARIHYAEVGQAFESESLIRRYARHGAYRSARFRFPLGKKARPLAVFKSTGARFEVIPEKTVVTVLDESVPQAEREKRGPFKGSWDQRYRLGDRYEVWLTRT